MVETSCTENDTEISICNNSPYRNKHRYAKSYCAKSSYEESEISLEEAVEPKKDVKVAIVPMRTFFGLNRWLAPGVLGCSVLSMCFGGLLGLWAGLGGLLLGVGMEVLLKSSGRGRIVNNVPEQSSSSGIEEMPQLLSTVSELPEKFKERVRGLEERAANLEKSVAGLTGTAQRGQLRQVFGELLPAVVAGFVKLNATTEQTAGDVAMKGEVEFVEVLEEIEGRLAVFEKQQAERELELFRESRQVLGEYLKLTQAEQG